MSASAPVQILGAGLTGMSAGVHLGGDYEIHERQDRVGGLATTVEEDGYRFDRTGHLLHLRHGDIRRWVLNLLQGDVIEVQRRSRVFSHGVATRYPYQANTFGLPPQVAYECLDGFLRALAKRDAAPEPETFEQFCLTNFGEGFSKHFMIPFNSTSARHVGRVVFAIRAAPRASGRDRRCGGTARQGARIQYRVLLSATGYQCAE